MDQSKLLQIINKDLEELKELTNELIQSESLSKIEIEIALSKSKLIFQEFELLKEKSLTTNISNKEIELESIKTTEKNITQAHQEQEEPAPTKTTDNEDTKEYEAVLQNNETSVIEPEVEITENVTDEPFEKEQSNIHEEKDIVTPQIENIIEKTQEVDSNIESSIEQDEFVDKEEDEEPSIIVGETFSKGKSLNDSMPESKTLDQKFASSPINKLEPAIGLNDRFLFIRELFEGDSDKYSDAVTELDNLSDLKEAVNFLSTNYKWKKTEASLKFVELVKRRFQL